MKFKILATLLSLSFFAFSQDDSKQLEKIYNTSLTMGKVMSGYPTYQMKLEGVCRVH